MAFIQALNDSFCDHEVTKSRYLWEIQGKSNQETHFRSDGLRSVFEQGCMFTLVMLNKLIPHPFLNVSQSDFLNPNC